MNLKADTLHFSDLKVGITIILGLVILGFFLFMVGTEESVFSDTYGLKTFFPSVNGLSDGSIVTLGGLKIGRVKGMTFTRRNGQNGVVITLIINSKEKDQITRSSHASIRTIGMLGDKYVDISMGIPGEQPYADGDFIPAQQNFELADAAEELRDVVKDLATVASDVKGITGDIQSGKGIVGTLLKDPKTAAELVHAVRSLRAITDAVVQRQGTLGNIVYDRSLYSELTMATHNLRMITDSLRGGQGSLGRLLADDSLYASILALSQRLDLAAAKLNTDSSSIGAALNDGSLYHQLSGLIQKLDSLASDVRANPGKYVRVSLF